MNSAIAKDAVEGIGSTVSSDLDDAANSIGIDSDFSDAEDEISDAIGYAGGQALENSVAGLSEYGASAFENELDDDDTETDNYATTPSDYDDSMSSSIPGVDDDFNSNSEFSLSNINMDEDTEFGTDMDIDEPDDSAIGSLPEEDDDDSTMSVGDLDSNDAG